MKNYGDRGARYLHNSSYDTKAEFHNCFITHSKQFLVKYSYDMLTSIDVKFIFDSARLGGGGGGGGGGFVGLIFAGYVPLASQSPYPIIVYSVLFMN